MQIKIRSLCLEKPIKRPSIIFVKLSFGCRLIDIPLSLVRLRASLWIHRQKGQFQDIQRPKSIPWCKISVVAVVNH
ncbi:hypothetical protein ES703_125576 [subsurface metagenome]